MISPQLLPPVSHPAGWASWREVMDVALRQAHEAGSVGEVPVGAALLSAEGKLLAQAHNAPLSLNDPTAHAEMLCLRQGASTLGNYRLTGCILAVTLEPCIMCLGAMVHARIAGLVIGARDPKTGAVLSRLKGLRLPFLNHQFWVLEGIMAEECGNLLSSFFLRRRKARQDLLSP
ncbi:tRNA-adenosine deaminase [Desulfocurvibacter africanus PCS]|uniref:tRNA-specific adenosine deaminase n=1 Tax=Desulfocurvibacter africanus PCS TaxID=1262666 RepID=M5Q2R4_DESAF|nr:tRNA adenosine(34) deaminase TadA [Desulfocurvibacter africanus]EMG38696.1 tRNA-adenosine deaminase [Desulfocurvibacter africanus PCS]